MLIQGCQRAVSAMTQVAFVCIAVPRAGAGKILGIVAGGAIGEQTGRVGNYIVCIELTNEPVDSVTVQSSSTTFTGFKVKDERVASDKLVAT